MAGLVVIDASLAVKWIIPEPYTEQAFRLSERWVSEQIQLIAPCLILAEVTNAIFKRVNRRELDLLTAREALRTLLAFHIEIREQEGLPERALELAQNFRMSASYGAHYLALAESVGCDLWTGDRKLYERTKSQLSWVKWIGSFGARMQV